MASQWPPKKNTAFDLPILLVDSGNRPHFKVNPTLGLSDIRVSIDFGACAILETSAIATPASGALVKVSLASNEMNGDIITVMASDLAGDEWDPVSITLFTTARSHDALAYPTASGVSMDVTAGGTVGLDLDNVEGTIGASDLAASVLTNSKFAAGAIDNDALAASAIDNITFKAGAIDADVIADSAIDNATLATDMDAYIFDIIIVKGASNDEYSIRAHKNGEVITSGITSPTIQVIKDSDGTDLVASTALTEIGSLGTYKHSESTNRIVDGSGYGVKVQATIGGATRTGEFGIGRDS